MSALADHALVVVTPALVPTPRPQTPPEPPVPASTREEIHAAALSAKLRGGLGDAMSERDATLAATVGPALFSIRLPDPPDRARALAEEDRERRHREALRAPVPTTGRAPLGTPHRLEDREERA